MEPKIFALLPWLVALPAMGALVAGVLGRRWGNSFSAVTANLAVFGAFGLSVYASVLLFQEPQATTSYVYDLYGFLSTQFLDIQIAFQFDRLSAVMVLVVTGVSALIHLYSVGYMAGDRSCSRYFSYLNMFVSFMLLLVLGKNLLVMFVGWEGVGLSSYLLIGFWYEDMAKARAGKKAFIVNRIGDFGFMLGMLILVLYNQGSLDFASLQEWATSDAAPAMNAANMTAICLLLFLGAAGKSAQIPLFVWLPDAMAGPTPVSALIHAATMVTAGVYMVARLSFLFVRAPMAMAVIAGVGVATALLAAAAALVQRDIKKVLAYSTISQLGFMFLAVGSGAFSAGIFHLTTHAFFKACLFLGAGSVIHALHHEQDIFKMGGLARKMPVTHATFLLATLALAGLPPLAGFFSKEAILNAAFLGQTAYPVLYRTYWALGLAAAFLTAFYIMRLYWLTFRGETSLSAEPYGEVQESPWTMTVPLVILALLAGAAGLVAIPGESHLFRLWLAPVLQTFETPLVQPGVLAHWGLVGGAVVVTVAGLALAFMTYRKGPSDRLRRPGRRAWDALSPDRVYAVLFVRPFKGLARVCYRVIDVVLIDLFVVNGAALVVKLLSRIPRVFHNGHVQQYLVAVVIGLACLWFVL